MFELSTTAERLRIVKRAYHEFLTLWAVEQALDSPRVTDRICLDLSLDLSATDHDPFGRSSRGLMGPGGNVDEPNG